MCLYFRKKPITKERLLWWLRILLTRIFGRRVHVEGRPEPMKILPIVWGGRLHLLGLEHDFIKIEFTTQYTAQLIKAPPVSYGINEEIYANDDSPQKVMHVMLSHLSAAKTDALLAHAKKLSRHQDVLLAYGGRIDEFKKVQYPDKFFVQDDSLRGVGYLQSYNGLLKDAFDYMQNRPKPDWIFFADYDALPIAEDYLRVPVALAKQRGAGFLAKEIRDVTSSNFLFLANAVRSGLLGYSATNARLTNQRIYHSLGAAFLVSWSCFEDLVKQGSLFANIYFEIAIPTMAAAAGHRLVSIDCEGSAWKHVRYRPLIDPNEIPSIQAEGHSLVHPVKEFENFLAL